MRVKIYIHLMPIYRFSLRNFIKRRWAVVVV
jgi:hypothetical protein